MSCILVHVLISFSLLHRGGVNPPTSEHTRNGSGQFFSSLESAHPTLSESTFIQSFLWASAETAKALVQSYWPDRICSHDLYSWLCSGKSVQAKIYASITAFITSSTIRKPSHEVHSFQKDLLLLYILSLNTNKYEKGSTWFQGFFFSVENKYYTYSISKTEVSCHSRKLFNKCK